MTELSDSRDTRGRPAAETAARFIPGFRGGELSEGERLERLTAAALSGILADPNGFRGADAAREAVHYARLTLAELNEQAEQAKRYAALAELHAEEKRLELD